MTSPKRIVILGSTGSIGTQTLEVVRWRGYQVVGLAAGKNADLLIQQAHEFKPEIIACDAAIADKVRAELPKNVKLVSGDGANETVAEQGAEVVVAAISGIAGLGPTVAALKAGRQVALANKEAMVVAGPLVWEVARAHGANIIPLDSEHSALFQCLVGESKEEVESLILTASGGPFLNGPADLSSVSLEQTLKHPNWNMGAKVTVDSATLFNKGLEVLEAHFLFEIALSNIEVVIHPQSLVHSLVRFRDGNIKAQIGPHDMRVPIHYGLEYPKRPAVPLSPLPLEGSWEFLTVDHQRFPSLELAYEAGRLGGVAPAALNAADEVAVEGFLRGELGFMDIPKTLAHVLERTPKTELSWEALYQADSWAREEARAFLQNTSTVR